MTRFNFFFVQDITQRQKNIFSFPHSIKMQNIINIYTAARKTILPIDPDLEYNVADMKLELLFLPKCKEIWKKIETEILQKKEEIKERPLEVIIRCEYGQQRSVETANRLKIDYLKNMKVNVKHYSYQPNAFI